MYGEYPRFMPESDLATERRRADVNIPGVEYKKEKTRVGTWERISILSDEGAKAIGRPIGQYDTLGLGRMDMLDIDEVEDAKDEIARELCRMCDKTGINPERILVVGLGNRKLTPDAIGAEAAATVDATRHIKRYDPSLFSAMECAEISVIIPGVTAEGGIDTADIVEAVSREIQPTLVFAIDALASRAPERLGTTVQISNTGIFPGSGLGYGKKPINRETTGAPVIAIGVPTVIDSRLFCGSRVCDNEMFVSPKDIHLIVRNAAEIIGGGINQAFGM